MRLYFVRHGESTANTERIIWSRDEGHPLTETGRCQAQELARSLKSIRFSQVYCSPIQRAIETGEILNSGLDTALTVRDGLREIGMGELEGQSSQEAWAKHNELYRTWWTGEDLHARFPAGESYAEARERFVAEVQRISFGDQDGKNILVVSHGGILASMLPGMMANLPDNYGYSHLLGNTAYVLVEKRGDQFYCLKWQDECFNLPE